MSAVLDGARVTPGRSLEQRMDALERANEIRSCRKGVKADLKAGRASPREVILAPAEELETMKVFDLLLACPKVGRVKANKYLMQTRVSPSKTLGGLSPRQRRELVGLMGRFG